MSLHRFFLDEQVLSAESLPAFVLRLSEEDLRHARVLRLKPGEHIAVVDAANDYFECKVEGIGNALEVSISSRLGSSEPPFKIALYQALAKGDKMETVIRHATEVGASSFVPFATSRSVPKLDASKAARKRDRWASVARSAAMQSGRGLVPDVAPVKTFQQACESLSGFDAVVVFWEEAGLDDTIASALGRVKGVADARVAIVVGPEGGLSGDEVETMLGSNDAASVASLGANILRTETAGIVGSALVSYELGGMGGSPCRIEGEAV